MPLVSQQADHVLAHPGAFALQVLRAFRANQGLLLAGAVAYYALLSIVPLLILVAIAASHVIDQADLLETLRRALSHVAPSQGGAVVAELAAFLEHRDVIGLFLLATMFFFSALGFKVLETAISVIFLHRIAQRKRHFLVSALLPFAYVAFIAVAMVVGTVVLSLLIGMGEERLHILGYSWPLGTAARFMLYVAGVTAEILLISSIYLFMPVGRLPVHHALIGGVTAGLLWEIVRHVLAWYFAKFAQVSVVYGSLTTAIVVLLSLEIAATLVLLGAQVIAEYERIGQHDDGEQPPAMRTEEGADALSAGPPGDPRYG